MHQAMNLVVNFNLNLKMKDTSINDLSFGSEMSRPIISGHIFLCPSTHSYSSSKAVIYWLHLSLHNAKCLNSLELSVKARMAVAF